MYQSDEELTAQRHRARHFTEVAYALAALAALAFAALISHTNLGAPLTEEARSVVTWSFVGLAALDATLLLTWQYVIRWIATHQ